MKINKDDLIIKEAHSWTHSNFHSYYFALFNYKLSLKDNVYDVFIGNFRIAQILELQNKVCIISSYRYYYKSLDNALKKIVKEINKRDSNESNKHTTSY